MVLSKNFTCIAETKKVAALFINANLSLEQYQDFSYVDEISEVRTMSYENHKIVEEED